MSLTLFFGSIIGAVLGLMMYVYIGNLREWVLMALVLIFLALMWNDGRGRRG